MTSRKAGRREEKEARSIYTLGYARKAWAKSPLISEKHAPDFRPYPSTIDRADKILQLRARGTVDGEEAEERTKDEWR